MENHFNYSFRIVFESREIYRVMDDRGHILKAEMSGKVRARSRLWPAVGDYVTGRPQTGDWILIDKVLPRATVLQRMTATGPQVLAANVDTLIIVTSANQELNLNRLDRYHTMAVNGGVRPVIAVNKVELAADPHALLDSIAARFKQVDVIGVSAWEGWNLDALEAYASEGQTLAFVGSSGVGKSTLTNAILGQEIMVTHEIRQDDGRGRHTTTHRELHVTSQGAVIIDTPGLREVGIGDADLNVAFEDIESLASLCRFSNCRHDTEPGCAILAALASQNLDSQRWQSYLKLQREVAFERRRHDKALQSEEKKKWAKISKLHGRR